MGADRPKQYLPLAGVPLLLRTLERLLACSWIERLFVVIAPDDRYWDPLVAPALASEARVAVVRLGGETRAYSVRAGLRVAYAAGFANDDWVLVHDAARPCVDPASITHLRSVVSRSNVGGLLALPVTDTVKLSEGGGSGGDTAVVERTVPRERLWLAQTPQLFRLAMLRQALDRCPEATDEASAVERLGFKPLLVRGSPANLKVTMPGDLLLAEAIWLRQEQEQVQLQTQEQKQEQEPR